MFWLAAAAIVSTPAFPEPSPARVEARATVRILSGVRLRFDGRRNPDAPPAHRALVRSEGKTNEVRLIEFE